MDVITGDDRLIVDNWRHVSLRLPELKMPMQEGKFGFDDIHAEWPDVVGGRSPGRESPAEVIVHVGLGIWGEYAAILPEVYRRASALGLGQRMSGYSEPCD